MRAVWNSIFLFTSLFGQIPLIYLLTCWPKNHFPSKISISLSSHTNQDIYFKVINKVSNVKVNHNTAFHCISIRPRGFRSRTVYSTLTPIHRLILQLTIQITVFFTWNAMVAVILFFQELENSLLARSDDSWSRKPTPCWIWKNTERAYSSCRPHWSVSAEICGGTG